jgi:hypothetical protein
MRLYRGSPDTSERRPEIKGAMQTGIESMEKRVPASPAAICAGV